MNYFMVFRNNIGLITLALNVLILALVVSTKVSEGQYKTPILTNAIRKDAMMNDCIFRSNDKQFCANVVAATYPVEMLKAEWEFAYREKDQTTPK